MVGCLKAAFAGGTYSAIASLNVTDQGTLETLADTNFDPAKTVLVSAPLAVAPAANAINDNSGTVEFKSYAPNDIVLGAQAAAPSVLLLNDMFDPHWQVYVDGKPAELLRCNFIMRGVYLTPGAHTVEFQFSLPHKPLYITLAAIGVGILLVRLPDLFDAPPFPAGGLTVNVFRMPPSGPKSGKDKNPATRPGPVPPAIAASR